MNIVIDREAAEPPFAQVHSQITAAISSGGLPVGTRLPSVRSLAGQIGVAPGTVARAYRELETLGRLDTRGRHGTYVSDPTEERAAHRRQLAELAKVYAETAGELGIRPTDALELIDQALRNTPQPG